MWGASRRRDTRRSEWEGWKACLIHVTFTPHAFHLSNSWSTAYDSLPPVASSGPPLVFSPCLATVSHAPSSAPSLRASSCPLFRLVPISFPCRSHHLLSHLVPKGPVRETKGASDRHRRERDGGKVLHESSVCSVSLRSILASVVCHFVPRSHVTLPPLTYGSFRNE